MKKLRCNLTADSKIPLQEKIFHRTIHYIDLKNKCKSCTKTQSQEFGPGYPSKPR